MSLSSRRVALRIARKFSSRWLQGYVAGKVRLDPAYAAVYERVAAAPLPLLDIGCGLGLLAFSLRERGFAAPIAGIDVDERKIEPGRVVAAAHYPCVTLGLGSALTLPEHAGHVCMLDVLHYFSPREQAEVLQAMAQRVEPGAWCIIRTTPRDGTWRFRATQIEEVFARAISWMARPAIAFPPLDSISVHFPAEQFESEIHPLWGATPFNSWLLAFRRR